MVTFIDRGIRHTGGGQDNCPAEKVTSGGGFMRTSDLFQRKAMIDRRRLQAPGGNVLEDLMGHGYRSASFAWQFADESGTGCAHPAGRPHRRANLQ